MLEFEQANPLPISLYFYCRKPCTLIAEFFVLELPKILYFTLPFTVLPTHHSSLLHNIQNNQLLYSLS